MQVLLSQRHRHVGLATIVYVFLFAPAVATIPMAFGPTNALEFPPSTYSLDLFRIFFNSESWLLPLYTSRTSYGRTAMTTLASDRRLVDVRHRIRCRRHCCSPTFMFVLAWCLYRVSKRDM